MRISGGYGNCKTAAEGVAHEVEGRGPCPRQRRGGKDQKKLGEIEASVVGEIRWTVRMAAPEVVCSESATSSESMPMHISWDGNAYHMS